MENCFAHRQLCVCDRCDEEVQLINMAQWEFAEWESGISWCRRCFQMCGQFKTERNTGPRVPDKKKQAQVNTSVQKICTQHPVSWSECMTCIDAEFPDPTETCKFLQSDAKRVPKTSVGKHCELVRSVRRAPRLWMLHMQSLEHLPAILRKFATLLLLRPSAARNQGGLHYVVRCAWHEQAGVQGSAHVFCTSRISDPWALCSLRWRLCARPCRLLYQMLMRLF